MSENTKIEWCDHTFNPWLGCTKVSPGCKNCYAERQNTHRKWVDGWGPGAPRKRTSAANWKLPLKWEREEGNTTLITSNRPKVFCGSLCDWLDDEVPVEWLADLLSLIHATPNLDWLLLTKRPENWAKRLTDTLDDLTFGGTPTGEMICQWYEGNHPANVWIGTTVENQEMAKARLPKLLQIPGKVRFISCEPLLGPINLGPSAFFPQNFWVIAGGESGPKARPMHPDWPRSLRDQCQSAAVPFLFKQWGEWEPGPDYADDPKAPNADWQQVCDQESFVVTMYRVGKKVAGRLLDGSEWNQFPAV